MKIREFSGYLERLAPLALQEDYDNSGLILGDQEMEVSGILITLDVTEEVISEAYENNCNLVISHHPVIFKGLKKLTGAHFTERIAITAIRYNIALYCAHTNLDNIYGGLNLSLIRKLGVNQPVILKPVQGFLNKLVTFCPIEYADRVRQALFDAGAGFIGNYDCCSYNVQGKGTFRALEGAHPFTGERDLLHFEDEVRIEVIYPSFIEKKLVKALLSSHPYEEVAYDLYPLTNHYNKAGAGMIGDLEVEEDEKTFLQKVKEVLQIPVIRHSGWLNKKIKKIAVCGGSGSFLLQDAKQKGADIFLTGDIRYHDFFEPQLEIILADIGHYESEHVAKELFYSLLIEKFPNFAILISKTNINPVNYL
ncbi:MAG: Nif3-like dinuclear metal center hexameric protein [Bacteroidetes bacterium]|nr:Nif3-like dinuclear metal center hexameric protein [Bacteroidota bacterium]